MTRLDNKNYLYDSNYYQYENYYNAGPFYCWTKGKVSSSEILDLYPGARTVQVRSDIPFYIHTVWHDNDLGSNPDEWEYYVFTGCDHPAHTIDIDESFISEAGCECSEGNYITSPYIYQIPLDSIPKGKYFTTVCHFADGSAVMSDVRKK